MHFVYLKIIIVIYYYIKYIVYVTVLNILFQYFVTI